MAASDTMIGDPTAGGSEETQLGAAANPASLAPADSKTASRPGSRQATRGIEAGTGGAVDASANQAPAHRDASSASSDSSHSSSSTTTSSSTDPSEEEPSGSGSNEDLQAALTKEKSKPSGGVSTLIANCCPPGGSPSTKQPSQPGAGTGQSPDPSSCGANILRSGNSPQPAPTAGGSSASGGLGEEEVQLSTGGRLHYDRDAVRMMNVCSHHRMKMRARHVQSVACQTDDLPDDPTTSIINYPPVIKSQQCDQNVNDGTLRLMIQNFRNMTDTVRGPNKKIQGVCWRIMVMPRQHVVQKKGTQKCLGFFLQCCPDSYSDAWSCQAAAELRLISQKTGVPHFTRKTNHNYTAKENDWGYSCFMTWADILDESQGYIKDDRVILEVSVKAEPPKNILTHDEFKKKIQDWYDLAEMQYHRNKIDLAIEANAKASALCKDRDLDCKQKLDEQKAFFIERKLMDSILRIEKGKYPGKEKPAEDGVSNHTALRMAITSSGGAAGGQHKHGGQPASTGQVLQQQQAKKEKNKKDKKNSNRTTPVPNKPANQTDKTKLTQMQNAQKKELQKALEATKPAELTGNLTGNKEMQEDNGDVDHRKAYTISKSMFVALLDGGFNAKICDPYHLAQKRTRTEEEMYAQITKTLEVLTENLTGDDPKQEKDIFVNRYITEQLKNFTPQERTSKKAWFSLQQLKHFAENAYDIEIARQEIIKKSVEEAVKFMEKSANSGPVDYSDMEEMEWELAMLWEEGKQEARANIVEREARFLDAKIRLFWNEDDNSFWLDDDLCISSESLCSNDSSDRQNDGCIKAKRPKYTEECDSCMRERFENLHLSCPRSMCDSGSQTDSFLPTGYVTPLQKDAAVQLQQPLQNAQLQKSPGNTQRVIRKPNRKGNKNSTNQNVAANAENRQNINMLNAQIQQGANPANMHMTDIGEMMQHQQMYNRANNIPNNMPILPSEARSDESGSEPTASRLKAAAVAAALAGILPMEYAMEIFDKNKPQHQAYEEWLRSQMAFCYKNNMMPSAQAGAFPAAGGQPLPHATLVPTGHLTGITPEGMPVNIEFGTNMTAATGPGGEQVVDPNWIASRIAQNPVSPLAQTLQAVVYNCSNIRGISNCVDDIIRIVNNNVANDPLRKALKDISKIAGLAYVENEDKFQPLPTFHEEGQDDDLNKLFERIAKQLAVLKECKSAIEKFTFLDIDDGERLVKGASAIEQKYADNSKKLKEMQKAFDDSEAKLKKLEKTLKDENKQLKQNVATEKEKLTSVNKEMKEKNKEIKKLEQKANSAVAERDELNDKVKQLQKDLTALQKKAQETENKLKRDLNQALESKKHIQAELSNRDAEVKSTTSTVEELKQQLKRSRDELHNERNRNNHNQHNLKEAIERAKKSEIALLQRELDHGLAVLERAKEDATKQMKDMEEAANSRMLNSRNSSEMTAMLTQSRNEWAHIIEQLKEMIEKAKTEFNSNMDEIKKGKALANLPKVAVPKPPPPPAIIKVPPIAPVEPTKPLPGAIGTRPQQNQQQQLQTSQSMSSNAVFSSQTSNLSGSMSPGSRAPGSPIGTKSSLNSNSASGSGLSTQPLGNSPARHGPIGSRPNAQNTNSQVVSSAASEPQPVTSSNSTAPDSMWHWSDSISAITESLLPPAKRNLNNFGSTTNSNNLFSWDDAWAPPSGSSMASNSGLSSGLRPASTSFMNQPPSIGSNAFGPPPPSAANWMEPNQPPNLSRMYNVVRQPPPNIQPMQQLLDQLSRRLNMDIPKVSELLHEYMREHKMYDAMNDGQIVERLRDYHHKRMNQSLSSIRMPPGAAPGYAMNPVPFLGGLLDRPSDVPFSSAPGANGAGPGSMHPNNNDKWPLA